MQRCLPAEIGAARLGGAARSLAGAGSELNRITPFDATNGKVVAQQLPWAVCDNSGWFAGNA